jgi:NAD(P)-dependent dehydrogenase (short-subunit alcohol dehydrogenase family)
MDQCGAYLECAPLMPILATASPMAPSLAGRVAIVTGAGKGLGRAYALDMAARGAAIVVNNRWADRALAASADRVVAEIISAGGRAVASYDSAEHPDAGGAMVDTALRAFGRLDAIVANAGVPETKRLHRQTAEGFREIFEINFFGTLHLVHAAWAALAQSGAGRVVVSASSAGLHGGDGMAAYAASKAALLGLVRALAIEGASRGLCVNAIAPYAATAMTQAHLPDGLGDRMAPQAVAPLVAWLASAACDVTGQTLLCGGGRVRAAFAVEAPLTPLAPEAMAASVHRAIAARPFETYPDAHQAFAAFMAQPAFST